MRFVIAVLLIVLGVSVYVAILIASRPHDDTDEMERVRLPRSGLFLYTDAGTGCQYVGASQSSITPRLGADGRPLCDPRLRKAAP